MDHHRYESELRLYLAAHLARRSIPRGQACQNLAAAIQELHHQYMSSSSDPQQDTRFILRAAELLMAGCLPAAA